MRTTLFVREQTAKGAGKLRQVAADNLEHAKGYIQGANEKGRLLDARIELELALGIPTTGAILALINCGK